MIKKKWNLEEMQKRISNLKKVINPQFVDLAVARGKLWYEDLDALYFAYYELKDDFLKYKRSIFGKVNKIDYMFKERDYPNIALRDLSSNTFFHDNDSYESIYGSAFIPSFYSDSSTRDCTSRYNEYNCYDAMTVQQPNNIYDFIWNYNNNYD